jgi:predicted ArsR family transcriptional regulator
VVQQQVDQLRQWAVLGARQRLQELEHEQAAIFRAFPELRRGRVGRPPATFRAESIGAEEVRPGTDGTRGSRHRRRRRRTMSAEARKRISDAQKARWAKQKAEGSGSDVARKKR